MTNPTEDFKAWLTSIRVGNTDAQMKSVRSDIIKILNRAAAESVVRLEPHDENLKLVADLIAADYLTGVAQRNEVGVYTFAHISGITLKGREYVEQLENEEESAKPTRRAMNAVSGVLLWAGGVLTTLLVQYLLKVLGLS